MSRYSLIWFFQKLTVFEVLGIPESEILEGDRSQYQIIVFFKLLFKNTTVVFDDWSLSTNRRLAGKIRIVKISTHTTHYAIVPSHFLYRSGWKKREQFSILI